MTVSAEELPWLKSAFRPYVDQDHKRFLSSFDPDSLEKGTIFDLQHQGLLRIAQVASSNNSTTMFESYASSHQFRRELLHELQYQYSEMNTKSSIAYQLPKAGMRFGNDSYLALKDIVGSETNAPGERSYCLICNTAGVGLFELEPYKLLPDANDLFATKNEMASVGASMYYAFNTSSPDAYLQTYSINVLASSLSSLKGGGWKAASLQHAQTMRTLGSMDTDEKALANSLTGMFGSHEMGHRPSHPGNSYLIDLLQELGEEGRLIYRVGFPTPYELLAWRRLKDGKGTLADVLFILGDTLANIAWLQAAPAEETVKALELFLTWLIKEPTPRSSPRGNLSLFMYLLDRDMPALLDRTRSLIAACAREPTASAEILAASEDHAWERLKIQLADA